MRIEKKEDQENTLKIRNDYDNQIQELNNKIEEKHQEIQQLETKISDGVIEKQISEKKQKALVKRSFFPFFFYLIKKKR